MLDTRTRKRLAKAIKENKMESLGGQILSLNDKSSNESDTVPLGAGVHRELLMNSIMGKYYALLRKGKIFIHTTVVAGVAIPISTTVAPPFGVWNPSDSGKLVIPLIYANAYVSGTNVQTGIGLGIVTSTGGSLATAAPISAMTAVSPRNGLIGLGDQSRCTGFSASTLTTAGTFFYSLGQNTFTGAATVPVSICGPMWWDFDGLLGIPPGNLIYPVGNAASVGLYQQTLVVAELYY